MGKKKHRSRRAKQTPDEPCETSEEEVLLDTLIGPGCPHVSKSTSLSNLRKSLKDVKLRYCQQCDGAPTDDGELQVDIWMCLFCGNQGCGRNSLGKHALLHYQTPRSDTHYLALSLTDFNLWCYVCDSAVQIEGNKKLSECVDFVKKRIDGDSTPKQTLELPKGDPNINNLFEIMNETKGQTKPVEKDKRSALSNTAPKTNFKSNQLKTNETENVFKIKGLINLGNTCFLNSVLQCLVQTNILFEILSSREANGFLVILGNHHENDNNDVTLPQLEIYLPELGPLSSAFCHFFKDYTCQNKTVNPGQLLGQICKRAPQFRGGSQQDSHELLRHFLDGIKSEEIKRCQTGILRSFGFSEKVNPKIVDAKTKSAVKAYGRCIPSTLIDHIFSGQLISTVLCEECGMSSQVFEPFLDLSLPVTEEKVNRPGMGKKSMNEGTQRIVSDNKWANDKPSKHQEKKSKRQAKKNAKTQRNRAKQERNASLFNNSDVVESQEELIDNEQVEPSLNIESKDSDPDESDTSDDADVEDNAESGSTCSTSNQNTSPPVSVQGKAFPNNDEDCSNNEKDNVEISDRLKEINLNEENVLRVNGLNGVDGSEVEDHDCSENTESAHQQTKTTSGEGKARWMTKSQTTMAPRYQPMSQECSIYSCLNQFTASELLTGQNKFGCENCTRIKKEKDSASSWDNDGKSGQKSSMVYTNASKQLLIISPPAILTLHLKRFQQVGYNLRKVNRHVDFPLLLDLAPFCSSICLGLPTLKENQHRVLYYLYGVVEHSGRLNGGHYTAYVRSSPKKQSFLNFETVSQSDINKLIEEMQSKLCDCDDISSCSNNVEDSLSGDADSSRWYHISDSAFSEVLESSVLRCQAYLLFYKRIL